MVQKGLVERDTSNTSGYRAKICLTDAGQEAAEYVDRRAQQAVEAAGCDLNDADRKVLYAALESISARLQSISRDGIPNHESKE